MATETPFDRINAIIDRAQPAGTSRSQEAPPVQTLEYREPRGQQGPQIQTMEYRESGTARIVVEDALAPRTQSEQTTVYSYDGNPARTDPQPHAASPVRRDASPSGRVTTPPAREEQLTVMPQRVTIPPVRRNGPGGTPSADHPHEDRPRITNTPDQQNQLMGFLRTILSMFGLEGMLPPEPAAPAPVATPAPTTPPIPAGTTTLTPIAAAPPAPAVAPIQTTQPGPVVSGTGQQQDITGIARSGAQLLEQTGRNVATAAAGLGVAVTNPVPGAAIGGLSTAAMLAVRNAGQALNGLGMQLSGSGATQADIASNSPSQSTGQGTPPPAPVIVGNAR